MQRFRGSASGSFGACDLSSGGAHSSKAGRGTSEIASRGFLINPIRASLIKLLSYLQLNPANAHLHYPQPLIRSVHRVATMLLPHGLSTWAPMTS